jgi:peptide/nickel transport system permease protein
VTAAKALGASHLRIMLLYVLPMVVPTLLVIALLELAALMVAESIMAFVGLGIQPPGISWGTILSDGRENLLIAPWMALLPGLAIFVSVLGVNLLADGLADVLDPKLRGGKLIGRLKRRPSAVGYRAGARNASQGPDSPNGAVPESLLTVDGLRVEFPKPDASFVAVTDVGFSLGRGERLGIVGESGSGKSVTGLSIMDLLEAPGQVTAGSITFKGKDLLRLPRREMNEIRGGEIAMIFQDPSSSLNPTLPVARQITEAITQHQSVGSKVARERALEALRMVNINDPERVAESYPFQLSGGMQQRVMIATALSCEPALLIADEPTTALDVTTQAQILNELDNLVQQFNTGVILITHDFGVVAEFTERVVVMQDGVVREAGPTEQIVNHPRHPYTKELLKAVMELEEPEGQRR